MRKVLSFVLVLSLVLGSFSMAFAATPFEDVAGEPSEEAVAVLSELGVVSGYDDGTYKPENIVTRAEMAVLIIRALGLTDYVSGTAKSSFTDMAGYGWAEGYIAYAESLGFMSGYGDGTVKPGNTVTYDEATSMLVRALGYTTESLTGSWPANFVVRAKSLGILDGIQAGPAGANRGDVAIMLYQTLDLEIGTVDNENRWNKNDPSDTMLARLGAEMYVPSAYINESDDSFLLTDDIAEDAVGNVRAYVGAVVSAYANDDNEIIAIKTVYSTFLTGDFINGDTKFESAGTDYTVVNAAQGDVDETTPDAVYFINGYMIDDANDWNIAGNWSVENVKDLKIAADVSGKRINEIYSVAKWVAKDVFPFDTDYVDEISEDMTIKGFNFPENDNREIDLTAFELLGIDSLDALEEDNVVAVYLKDNNDESSDIVKIEVGTKVVKGKVTRATSGGNAKYTINGTAYSATNGLEPKVGDEGTFFLDYNGKLAFFEGSGLSGNYAMVLVNPDLKTSYGSNNVWQVKLLTKDGDEKIFIFDEDVATSAAIANNVIEIDINRDGELTTAAGLGTLENADGGKLSARDILDGNLVSDDVVVFINDADTGNDWTVGKLSDIKVDKTFSGGELQYLVDDENGEIVLIVAEKSATEFTNTYGVILGNAAALNDDDDQVRLVTALINGAKVEYYTDDKTLTASDKDTVYKFTLDGDVITAIDPATSSAIVGTPNWAVGEIKTVTTAGFTTVTAVSGDRVQLATIGYELIEGADVYVATFKNDGSFDGYALGSASSITTNSKVMLFQTDENSDNWDLVVVIRRADTDKGAGLNLLD
jgi:hypothetical protein